MDSVKDIVKEGCSMFMYKHGLNYKDEIIRLEIPIKALLLVNENPYLGDLALHSPIEAGYILKAEVYNMIITNKYLPRDFLDENLIIVPRYSGFPLNFEYKVTGNNFAQESGKRYYRMTAILTMVSKSYDYTQCAQFTCVNEDCSSFKYDKKHVKVHTPGVTEWDLTKPKFRCFVCECYLQEDIKKRKLGKKVSGAMICASEITLGFDKSHEHVVQVCFRDELVDLLELGQAYYVVGIPLLNKKEKTRVLEVNNLIKIPATVARPLLPTNQIFQMVAALKTTPWSSCLNLAYCFATDITSPGFLFKVKLGLLLSLVGVQEDDYNNASLLVIGYESVKVKRLFKYAATFCNRRVYHTTNANIAGTANKDGSMLEIGSFELATGGVCVVDFNALTKPAKETLGRIIIKGSHDVTNYPLNCRVWAVAEVEVKKKRSSRTMTMGASNFQTPSLPGLSKTAMGAFSMAYSVGNPEDDDYVCMAEVEHCFNTAMKVNKSGEVRKAVSLGPHILYVRIHVLIKFKIQMEMFCFKLWASNGVVVRGAKTLFHTKFTVNLDQYNDINWELTLS